MSNFSNFKTVEQRTEFPTRWKTTDLNYKSFAGTFEGIKTCKASDGSTFEVIQFVNCTSEANGGLKYPDFDLSAYAVLKSKLKNLQGRRVGIEYLGQKPHPKNSMKTVQDFAVYLLDTVNSENLPF